MKVYFDFISPYAYLGWKASQAICRDRQWDLQPVPILFAALLNHHGHKGPAEIPPKRIYIFKHVARLAHTASIPIDLPASHPFNPLLPLRMAGLPADRDEQHRRVDALFEACWVRRVDMADGDAVADALSSTGVDGPALVQQAGQPEAKATLKERTAEAVGRGVFGVPTFELEDGELFWGYDSLPHVIDRVEGRDPVPPEMEARLAQVPVGAWRSGG